MHTHTHTQALLDTKYIGTRSVYRWERKLSLFKLHHTRSPTSEHDATRQLHTSTLASFQAHDETFLAVGFSGDGERHNIASIIYKLDTQNALVSMHTGNLTAGNGFQRVFSVPSVGVVDIEYVSVSQGGGQFRDLIVIANGEISYYDCHVNSSARPSLSPLVYACVKIFLKHVFVTFYVLGDGRFESATLRVDGRVQRRSVCARDYMHKAPSGKWIERMRWNQGVVFQ